MPSIFMQDVLQKTGEEIEKMTPAERATYLENQRLAVFGADSKVQDGEPVEQGIGSASQPTRNSIEAYKRWHGPHSAQPDSDFEKNLERMEAEYAEHLAARKAKGKRKVA